MRVHERNIREHRTTTELNFYMNFCLPTFPAKPGFLAAAGALALGFSAASAQAAIQTSVPMQGGMVMPMIAYHADHGHLHVMMDTNVPQLTPLMVSHPGDSFAPGDPWFDALDPSRQGASFSRRYGFVMDNMSDPLPAGTTIWLRKISASPELGFYRYSGSAPRAWQPVFGTAGSSNAMFWNTMMFHPGVTAPPGTNPLTAVFEAFLMNTNTATPVPNSSTGPFTLDWTNVADGRPAVNVGARVVLAWPTDATNWVVEAAESMPSTNWITLTNQPVSLDGRPALLLEPAQARMFFRMKRNP